jgi:hypothetical protein
VTICPCCGFKSTGSITHSLSDGCSSCGARSVGEPLPRPEHELPSYGRSLLLAVTGAVMVLIFVTQTIIALVKLSPQSVTPNLALSSIVPLDFWTWIAAAETAAWRLKWVMIPATMVALWFSRKLYHSILQSPARFCGLRYARNGYLASAAVPLLILISIGVTVPERLRQRQLGIAAGINAQIYRIDRGLDEYREKFGTLPGDLKDLSRLPDVDGSLASALKSIDTSGYTVNSEVAAVPTKKPRPLRGAVILNASVAPAGDEALSGGLSFTNYELPLSGPDNLKGTEDDLIVRDGVTYKVSEIPRRGVSTSSAAQKRQR